MNIIPPLVSRIGCKRTARSIFFHLSELQRHKRLREHATIPNAKTFRKRQRRRISLDTVASESQRNVLEQVLPKRRKSNSYSNSIERVERWRWACHQLTQPRIGLCLRPVLFFSGDPTGSGSSVSCAVILKEMTHKFRRMFGTLF